MSLYVILCNILYDLGIDKALASISMALASIGKTLASISKHYHLDSTLKIASPQKPSNVMLEVMLIMMEAKGPIIVNESCSRFVGVHEGTSLRSVSGSSMGGTYLLH